MSFLSNIIHPIRSKNARSLHTELQKQLPHWGFITRSHKTHSVTLAVQSATTGVSIKDVVSTEPADAGQTTDVSEWSLYGPTGKPASVAVKQGPTPDCYLLAPLGCEADWMPEFIQNLVQPVVDANNNLIPSLADVYILIEGVWNRIRVQAQISPLQNNASSDTGWWVDAYETAEAFVRVGANNTFAGLGWGFVTTTYLGMGQSIGPYQNTVQGIWGLMGQGYRPYLSTPGSNVPPGVTPSHVYWALPLNKQPEAGKIAPSFIRFQGPWGPDQIYDYTDSDVFKYWPMGSVCTATPPVIQIPQVKPNAAPPLKPVTPLASYRRPNIGMNPTIVAVDQQQSGPYNFYTSTDNASWILWNGPITGGNVVYPPSVSVNTYWCIGFNGVYGPSVLQGASTPVVVNPDPSPAPLTLEQQVARNTADIVLIKTKLGI